MSKSKKLSRDARLKEIAHVLAKGIIRMKEAGELLTSRSIDDATVLRKPPKAVNQRVSG